MPKIAIKDIVIGDRARVEMGDDYEQLRDSIASRGLINPICVHKDNLELVAGFRRLSCHRDLGRKNIEVKYYENLSPLEQKLIELEENIHTELTWNEQSKLRAEIHFLNQQLHGKAVKGHESDGHSLADTAKELNISTATLSQDISLAQATETMPELRKIQSRRQALKALESIQEAAILTELAKRQAEESPENRRYHLHHGDAVEYLKEKVEEETIDLVIFDPPWGVDIDRIASSRGPKGEKTSYKDDSEQTAINLIHRILPELYRVMKPDAHMYMFIGVQAKEFYMDILTNYITLERQIEMWRTLFSDARDAAANGDGCDAGQAECGEVSRVHGDDGGGRGGGDTCAGAGVLPRCRTPSPPSSRQAGWPARAHWPAGGSPTAADRGAPGNGGRGCAVPAGSPWH